MLLQAAALAICLITGLELTLRTAVHVGPSPAMSAKSAWLDAFEAVGENDTLILGSSRAMAGFPTARVAQHTEDPTRKLAYPGASFIPVLEALVADGFSGTVIADYYAPAFFSDSEKTGVGLMQWARQVRWEQRQNLRLRDVADTLLAVRNPWLFVQMPLVLSGDPHVNLVFARSNINAERDLIRPVVPSNSAQRQLATQVLVRLDQGIAAWTSGTQVDARVAQVRRLAETLHARGGRLIVVALPISGDIRRLEETEFPRELFWDRLAETPDATFVHYLDDPVLRTMQAYEGSHLTAQDAARATDRVFEILDENDKAHDHASTR